MCRRVGASELVRQDISAHFACVNHSLYVGEKIEVEVIEQVESEVNANNAESTENQN